MRANRAPGRTRGLTHQPWMWALLVCLLAVMPTVIQGRELLDRVLAVVSGTIITLSDAKAAIELGFVETRGARDPVAAALDGLIERRLVLDETLRYEAADPDMVSIEAMLWAARRRFPTDEAWESAKRRLGLTDDSIRSLAAEMLHVQEFVERRFEAQPVPSDADLRAYFDRHRAEFVRSGQTQTFEDVRTAVGQRVRHERREQAKKEWVSRLRRRADVSELYMPPR